MKNHNLCAALVFTALAIGLAGCVSFPAATIPGGTRADFILRRDVYKTIAICERAAGGGWDSFIVDTKIVEPPTSPTGRWREMWTVSRSGHSVEYPVTFTPSPRGGTDITVSRPSRSASGEGPGMSAPQVSQAEQTDAFRKALSNHLKLRPEQIRVEAGSGATHVIFFGVGADSERQRIARELEILNSQNPRLNPLKWTFQ
ncbi:MAG: hypothetical protein WCP06_07410 [Verrucomicrobiota bacterium]